ncbi:MAG TPA: hypothetical protein VN364_03915 [Bellilinea sp.]|nr:hypothetical protein [Bellilinea sp.]
MNFASLTRPLTRTIALATLVLVFSMSGCAPVTPAAVRTLEKITLTVTASLTPVLATPTVTLTPLPIQPSATPTITPTLEPAGCRKPPEDYDLVDIDGNLFNQRTIDMLEYAQSLYGGEIELTGSAITQGSFHDNGAASFGTHLGGGAVDLSVMRTGTWTVLYEDIPVLLQALRTAGFAAWLREVDEVFPGSGIHIHAIAIGDRDLSEPAQVQLTGDAGYFRGFSGLPPVNGVPTIDRFGGPVLCQWMLDAGYQDLREFPIP